MKTKSKQQFLSKAFFVFAMLFLFAGSEMWAQQFIQQTAGAQYNATCGGVIKVKSAGFTGVENAFVNTGDLNDLGTVDNPIPGVVDWSSTTADQQVQALYYERLVVSGGTKTMLDGIYVTGEACPTPVSGYANLATYPFYIAAGTGTVTFDGTFNYASSGDQTVWPTYNETGAEDNYDILNLIAAGTVTIPDDASVGASVITGSSALTVEGQLFVIGADPSSYDGAITINTGGTLATSGTGGITFNGDVTLEDSSAVNITTGPITVAATSDLTLSGNTSYLTMANGTNLNITGTIANNGDGTNLVLDCGSLVTYNGTQNPQLIMPTLASNPYGSLTLSGGEKQGDLATNYTEDVNICANFSLSDGNLDMFTNTGVLRMQDPAGTVTYAANEEVEGAFERVIDFATFGGEYIFNNALTSATFEDVATNPTAFKYTVGPGLDPNNYDDTKDVDRKITVNYTGNTGAFNMDLKAGYLLAEGPDGGAWTDPYTQASLRFYEADDAADPEKVGTGKVYGRDPAAGTDLGFLSLATIGSTDADIANGIALFKSGNDLLLRAGPTTFYSVEDGRWTNPGTWDEGTVPTQIDDAEIRTLVYVGIDGPFAGTSGGADDTPANNTKSEESHYGAGVAAARTITISNAFPAERVALLIGNEDNSATYVFKTAYNEGSSFINANTTAGIAFGTGIAAKNTFDATSSFQGLWVVPWLGGTPDGRNASFGTYQIENSGTINNEGVIELGQ